LSKASLPASQCSFVQLKVAGKSSQDCSDVFGLQFGFWTELFCYRDFIQSPADNVAQLAAYFRFVARRQRRQTEIRDYARQANFALIE
jgi:hypothetical protein